MRSILPSVKCSERDEPSNPSFSFVTKDMWERGRKERNTGPVLYIMTYLK